LKKTAKKIVKKSGNNLKMYFHEGTHDAIVKFQQETDLKSKELIYLNEIRPAIEKLVDNLIFIHTAGTNISHEEFKSDCVSFLYETLKKFDASRGSKAFSYFNVVAKNWIVVKTRQKQKYIRRHISIDDKAILPEFEAITTIVPNFDFHCKTEQKAFQSAQLNLLFNDIKKKLDNSNEITCIDSIIKLFSTIDDIDLFNKRAIFVYIREMTNLTSKQVSMAMSSIKRHYRDSIKEHEFDIFI